MKLRDILALSTLCVIVKSAWLAALSQPVILGFGAILAAMDLDVLGSLPFISKQDNSESITPDTVTRDGEEKVNAESDKKDVGLTEEELKDLKEV